MALDKLLTFTDYYNQLKTLDGLRQKWLAFMEQLKAVQDNLPEGKYLNAPYTISDSMLKVMRTSLDTVLPSGTNVVKKIYKDLGVIKYNDKLYVGFPESDLNNYLSGKTAAERSLRRVILLQGNNGCVGCCVRLINEFIPPQFSSSGYDILKCGGASTSWIYNYRWFEMEALGNLSTDGMVDLVSSNNIRRNASDPNIIFYPKQQIDVVSSIHSCYGSTIPIDVDFNKTKFCMDNNISSSSFAVKTKSDGTTNGEIIFTASKIGSSFIITVKPRLKEWQWAYSILVLLGRFSSQIFASSKGCNVECLWQPGEEFFPGDCISFQKSVCGSDSSCSQSTKQSMNNSVTNYHATYSNHKVSCPNGNIPVKMDCGEDVKAEVQSSSCIPCTPSMNTKFTCAVSSPTICQCNPPLQGCTANAIQQGIVPGYGCQSRTTRVPAGTYNHQTCNSSSQKCTVTQRRKPKETRETFYFKATGIGSGHSFEQLNGIYYLDNFLRVIDNMCVHSAISIIEAFNKFLKETNIPTNLTRNTPFPSLMTFCTVNYDITEGIIPFYTSWGVVRDTCSSEDEGSNIAEIDSCGLMQVHIGKTTTWTFFP